MDKVMKSFERMVCMTFLFILIITAMLLFSGCGEVRYVATSSQSTRIEESRGHDTVYLTKLVQERVVERVKDSTNVVVDEYGNEKSRSRVRDRYLFIENRDSINYYRAVADSLRALRTDTVEVPVPVERELTKWERTKMEAERIAVEVLGIFGLTALVAWIVRRKGKQKGGV